MIQANELRLGNHINYEQTRHIIVAIDNGFCRSRWWKQREAEADYVHSLKECLPIYLTSEILQNFGFTQLPHFTVNDAWRIDLGRKRILTVSCVGTPNEMVFISEEEPPKVTDVVVLRNYDYDGYTSVHDLQNIYASITKKELVYDPSKA